MFRANRKPSFVLTPAIVLLGLYSATAALCANITFAFTSGFQSGIFPTETDSGSFGGSARLSRVIRETRLASDRFVLLDTGDHFAGGIYSLFRGEPELELLNLDRYDAMLLGGEELAMGEDLLDGWAHRAGFAPVLTNFVVPPQCKLCRHVLPYAIFERGGLKVGVFGMVPADLSARARPAGIVDIDDDLISVAGTIVDELSKKCEVIVMLSQLDIERNLEIAGEVGAIDLIIASEWHSYADEPIVLNNGADMTVLVGCAEGGRARLGVLFTSWDDSGGMTEFQWSPILLDGKIPPDQKAFDIVESISNRIPPKRFVRTLDSPLDAREDILASGESNLGNLVCDAIISAYPQVEIALIPAGSFFGDRVLPAGILFDTDIREVFPYNERVAIVELRGDELVRVLDESANRMGLRQNGFFQVSGLTLAMDTSQAGEGRLAEVGFGGEQLDLSARFVVATTDFVASGGFGYTEFAGRPFDLGRPIAETVIDYLSGSLGTPDFEDRIKVLP